MTIRLTTDEKIAETSSKGNQEKWLEENLWYKLDQFGYEALTETLTSRILAKSNIEQDTPFTFVRYEMASVNVHKQNRTGCVSKNFLNNKQSIITVSTLLRKIFGIPPRQVLSKQPSDKKKIQYLSDTIKEYTGLKAFDKYITLLFEVDSLILNDDRHLNNIAVIEENGRYAYCPVFDNGAGLLSNMQILRTDIEPQELMKSLRASPFNMTFNRSLKSVRNLYGPILQMPVLSKQEILDLMDDLLDYYPKRDSGIIFERVTQCILERQKHLHLSL